MRSSLRSSSPSPSRGVTGALAAVAALTLAGCSGLGDEAESGPPRLTPNLQMDAAEAMIASSGSANERLNACELLDLTTAEVITLTDAEMPDVEPTGSGDLGLICTYGGPGSPDRAEAAADTGSDADLDDSDDSDDPDGTDGLDDPDGVDGTDETAPWNLGATTTTTTTETPAPPAFEPGIVPDTFAAGVVEPQGGAEAALAGQPLMLGARYACSEVRGTLAATVEGAPPAAPGAPGPVSPPLATAFIDCLAAPTGGGVEVHTILVSGDYLWHITVVQPETARSPGAEAEALAGLHRVARQILG
ncbi:hypothetical protein [uncultured Dietzia sp.]|uniref:hypothetical protein n=1 Tax=uncultured Dietzia sp. TaxID=395519 RepID=UPI0025F46C94|nr:hypothetical protein [uncultured Dietzia sp.]